MIPAVTQDGEHPTLEDVKTLLERDGRRPVLLHIEAKQKGPTWKGWQEMQYSDTLNSKYHALLESKENTGILLGEPSGNLCAIDADTDAFAKAFVALNPAFIETWTTKGQCGVQMWAYVRGDRPRQTYKLKVHKDSPLAGGAKKDPDKNAMVQIGEFRAEGGQSICRGIHPSGCHYTWPVAAQPITIEWDDIRWPNDIAIPWETERKANGHTASDLTLLKRAIALVSVEQLWDHFRFPDRAGKNPVSSPFREDNSPSFSIYDQGRRFKDHGGDGDGGDSYNFYQIATGKDPQAAFIPFVQLAGLGHELKAKSTQSATDPSGATGNEEQLFEELLSKYRTAVCTAAELESIEIIPRKPLMGNWMKEGDLGFVFGFRGSGKTFLVDAIATHVSSGKDLAEWVVQTEGVDVMIVDGEMPADDARDRIKGLSPGNPRLHILHHERLFDVTGLTMNLTDSRVQRVITSLCVEKKVKLLILDNLSCLFSGMKENDADAWELVLNWLLDLRRRRIAVIIVAHASRSGTMRGTSRREDAAFWVIKVDAIQDELKDGAHFETTFTKQRNGITHEWNRRWHFNAQADGEIVIGCDEISFDEKVLELIQAGLTSATEICEELQCSKSTVSKAAKRLVDKKLIEITKKSYQPRGFMNER